VKPIIAIFLFFLSLSCASANKSVAKKHYPVIGKVISVDTKGQTAAIDAAAIPGFMEAMTMDYPIASKAECEALHAGDHITGTLDVYDDGSYTLSHIKNQPAAAK
jgi:protein SCO1/2